MKMILAILALLFGNSVYAQFVKQPEAPLWLGLTVCSTRFSNPFSIRVNPASLAFIDNAVAGVCSEIKFLQTDLEFFYASAAVPLQSGAISVDIAFIGSEGFSQAKMGFFYAKKLSSRLSLGAAFNYHRLSAQGYGSRNAITADLGCQLKATEKLTVFFAANNPVGGMPGKSSGEKLVSIYTAGIEQRISEKVLISGYAKKEEGSALDILFMANYLTGNKIALFGGLSIAKSEGFFGSCIMFQNMEFRQAVGWKQGLGISPSLAVLFHKKKRD
ncbi:MAG: hypothetical protein ABI151_00750 [Chitinophagaceae bacterium]